MQSLRIALNTGVQNSSSVSPGVGGGSRPLSHLILGKVVGMCWILAVLAGCDFSSPESGQVDDPRPDPTGPGGVVTAPILYSMDKNVLCPGVALTLTGVNFPLDLDRIRLRFAAGVSRVPGLPIKVESGSDGNPSNGLETRVTVLVPGGVTPGSVEMTCDGIYAGALSYAACPQIMGWALDRNEQGRFLEHLGPIGYREPSYVKLYGIGFNELEEVILEDSSGNQQKIFPATIERNPIPPGGITGQVPTGYASIGFNLHDERNNVQHSPQTSRRDFIKVSVKTSAGLSNVVQIPVINTQNVQPVRVGSAINMVKVPTGVVTGSVRIYYNLYDLTDEVSDSYRIEVEWSADRGTSWYPAVHDSTDLESSGVSDVLPGTMNHRSRFRLFPTGGAVRCFTWDAGNDSNFNQLNRTGSREWTLQFRLRPVPRGNHIRPFSFSFVTPFVVYTYLEGRTLNDPIALERVKTFVETFQGTEYKDPLVTDASWGPPDAEDALVAYSGSPPDKPPLFGRGSNDVVLAIIPRAQLDPGVVRQYFEIDTEQTVIHHVFVEDAGTPNDPADDIVIPVPVDISNPGKEQGEFHLSRLYVCPSFQRDAAGNLILGADGRPQVDQPAQVNVTGTRPLIFRFSGSTPPPNLDFLRALFSGVTVFGVGPAVTFDLNGRNGGDGSASGPGAGGRAGPGGGAGGAGGTLEGGPVWTLAVHGVDGGLAGGDGGETLGAYDFDASGGTSQVRGGHGGGGGHKFAGRDGESGKSQVARFQMPRSGRGGPARGDAAQRYLTGGSGGGGGGAGYHFGAPQGTAPIQFGGGGGGGGGAMMCVGNGEIVIDPRASIQCNGGNGGRPAGANGGAGGGGSGGSIVLRAALSVKVDCASLQVRGGARGAVTSTTAGKAGDGSPGWIRLESASGGTPNCAVFRAETALSSALSPAEKERISVQSTTGFPEHGLVLIGAEEIYYERITANTLELLRRSNPTSHASGAKVYLKGLIAPYTESGVWTGGQVLPSPDIVLYGRARDGELHLRFEPGIDAATGEVSKDPETGTPAAVYEFDTDQGTIRGPSGSVYFVVSASQTEPGFLDLARLRIDRGVILRCVGTSPLRISVSSEADIAGKIDVSGFPGGLLVFRSDDPEKPLPGLGGRGGPGGANGGNGGTIIFRNGDVNDKSPSNVVPVHGAPGGRIPGAPVDFDRTPLPHGSGKPFEEVTTAPYYVRALPGRSTPAQNCGGLGQSPCIVTGGGGGGGGNLKAGTNGLSVSLGEEYGGAGGSAFGLDSFRWEGKPWPFGAGGGAGGGASPHVSADYVAGTNTEAALFKGMARYAPGTGGGGGGGSVAILAQDLVLRSTARILARGGNAYQSIDLGGNGGAGAGGYVFIQVKNTITVEPGAYIDVSGGTANLPVPIETGSKLPRYEGNIRMVGGRLTVVGGRGGDGAPGRIRLEAEVDSLALKTGNNASVTSGPLFLDSLATQAVSRPIVLGTGRGSVARSFKTVLQPPQIRFFQFGQPPGTEAVVLWEGARESLNQHGALSEFIQRVRDPQDLRHREFVRFWVHFLSNRVTGEAQAIDEIRLPYSYPSVR